MSDALPYCGHRFGGRPEPVARDVEPEPLEPTTEEEYLVRKKDTEHAKGFQTALLILEHHLRCMSEDARDEMEGHTGVWLETLQETALPGAGRGRRALEEAAKAWEQRI